LVHHVAQAFQLRAYDGVPLGERAAARFTLGAKPALAWSTWATIPSHTSLSVGGAMTVFARRFAIAALLVLSFLPLGPGSAAAAPEGTLTWGLHVTLASKWLDPAETEAFINPFMVLYAIHDALVKPMPAGDNTPSLAESWTVSKDNLTYEFVLRKGVKFHNGEPVTPEDVKFTFDRYRGAAAKLLEEKGREGQAGEPGRGRC